MVKASFFLQTCMEGLVKGQARSHSLGSYEDGTMFTLDDEFLLLLQIILTALMNGHQEVALLSRCEGGYDE